MLCLPLNSPSRIARFKNVTLEEFKTHHRYDNVIVFIGTCNRYIRKLLYRRVLKGRLGHTSGSPFYAQRYLFNEIRRF